MTTRPLTKADLPAAMTLYQALVGDAPLGDISDLQTVLDHPGTTLLGTFKGSALASLLTLHLLPNITNAARPYALIENVITHPDFRNQGFARQNLTSAIDQAWNANAYKIMLMTGKSANAKPLYEKLGFKADEKWAMTLRKTPIRQGR